jgi:hypothetical protein
MSTAERAVLAADIVDGRIILQGLTIKAVAALAGASVDYVHHALRLTPEQREQVRRGDRPLVAPRACASAAKIDWEKIGDDMLVEAIRRLGVDRTLEAAVEAERAGT